MATFFRPVASHYNAPMTNRLTAVFRVCQQITPWALIVYFGLQIGLPVSSTIPEGALLIAMIAIAALGILNSDPGKPDETTSQPAGWLLAGLWLFGTVFSAIAIQQVLAGWQTALVLTSLLLLFMLLEIYRPGDNKFRGAQGQLDSRIDRRHLILGLAMLFILYKFGTPALRFMVGCLLLLGNGQVWSFVLFGPGTLDFLERVLIGFLLSIAISPVFIYFVSQTGVDLNSTVLLISILGCMGIGLLAIQQKYRWLHLRGGSDTNSNQGTLVILQNSEIGSHRPLSIYLTSLLSSMFSSSRGPWLAIVARSESSPFPFSEHLLQIPSRLYSPLGNLYFSLRAWHRLAAIQVNQRVTVVHCLYPNSSLLAALLFKWSFAPHVKIVYDVRSPWIEMIFARQHLRTPFNALIRQILLFGERILCQGVDHFVFLSRGLADYYHTAFGVGDTPFSIIPTGFSPERFQVKTTPPPDWPFDPTWDVIGYVGTIDASRQLDTVIRYFHDIRQGISNTGLLLIGDGNALQDLKRLTDQLNLHHVIKFLGIRSPAEIPSYLAQCHAGLCHLPGNTVYDHSFALKILEYLAAGLPVIASDIPAHREIASQLPGVKIYTNASEFVAHVRNPSIRVANTSDLAPYTWSEISKQYQILYDHLH